jgi:hypothetical protein
MTWHTLYFASLLFIAFSAPAIAQQKTGVLTIDLAVRNNKFWVAHSAFDNNGIAYPDGTEAKLVGFINGTFDKLDEQLRRDSSTECFANSKNNNEGLLPCYQALTQLDTSGEGVAMAYVEALPDADIQFDFRQHIFNVLELCLWQGSPILLNPDQFDVMNYIKLSFPLQIRPPVDVDKINIVWDQQDTLSRRKVKRILTGLENALWFEQDIKAKLEKHYFLLSNELEYKIDDTLIRVLPQKIGRILVTTDNPEEVAPVFYNLLSTPLFNKFIQIPIDSLRVKNDFSDQIGFNFSLFKEGQTAFKQLPVFDTDLFQLYQMQLNKLNYALTVNPTPSLIFDNLDAGTELEQYVDVIANKIPTTQQEDTSNVSMAAPMPNADGVMGVSGQQNNPNEFGHSRLKDMPDGKTNKFKRNYLGVGFDYYIEDAFQVNGIFQRQMKSGSTLSAKIGYALNEKGISKGGVYASGSYFKDFVFFNALKKRMSVQLTANTLFSANRIILDESLKERRSGGKILSEIEWFRDISGNLLLSRFTLASQKITLNDFDDVSVIDTAIAFAEIGFLHNYSKNSAQYSTRLVIEPVFKFGISGINGTTSSDFYATSKLRIRFNQNLPNGFSINLDGQTEFDTKLTPVFEQSALQTNQSRGFKEDAVIGRFHWNIQPEFWLPLPRFGDKWSSLNQYFFKHIRIAAFADISYFDKTLVLQGKNRGYWYSPGLGIRFIKFPTQINFDWAYGYPPGNLLAGRSQFSINLLVNAPL